MKNAKFRVWDKTNKKMYSKIQLRFSEGKWAALPYGSKAKYLKDFELLQYTGLKDKNDKEIYKSDILKDSFGLIAKVIWFNNTHLALTGFTFKTVVPKGVGFESFGMSWLTTAEIIGNIYENPELLVKKEE